MEAPAWVCKKLSEFHPYLRLGWDAEQKEFGLIHLYHNRDSSRTCREFWGKRGTVFSRSGRPRPDWDALSRTPIYLTPLEHRDVFSGKVVWLVRSRWARPIATRVRTSAKEASRRMESSVDDLGYEMGNDIYRKSQRSGAGAPIVAKKFIKPTVNQKRIELGQLDMNDCMMPPTPPGGWDKHDKNDQGDATDLGSVG